MHHQRPSLELKTNSQLSLEADAESSEPQRYTKPFASSELYLRQRQIIGAKGLLPVAPSTFRRWIKAGLLPQPTKLSPGVSVWKASDIQAFIAQAEGSL